MPNKPKTPEQKAAAAAYARAWRKANPGYDRKLRPDRSEYSRKYNATLDAVEAQRRYRSTEKFRAAEARRIAAPAERLKRSARWKVKQALKKGIITRPPACTRCGKDRDLHAHHHDYAKPLEVQWLCVVCHAKEHRPL